MWVGVGEGVGVAVGRARVGVGVIVGAIRVGVGVTHTAAQPVMPSVVTSRAIGRARISRTSKVFRFTRPV